MGTAMKRMKAKTKEKKRRKCKDLRKTRKMRNRSTLQGTKRKSLGISKLSG